MALLTIRDAQIAALTDALESRWLRSEIAALYPARCAAMGADGVARFIEDSCARARRYGFGPDHRLSYVGLEIAFGETFMQEAWAQQALAGDAETAMQRLREAAIFRLAAIAEDEQRQEEADRQTMAPLEDDIAPDSDDDEDASGDSAETGL
jgi:hypothetical protein